MEELAMFLKEKPLSFKVVLVFFLAGLVLAGRSLYVRGTEQQDEPELIQPVRVHKPEHVRGVHLSAWVAGSGKLRERVWDLFNATEINTAVIAVKEYEGEVYIPGVKLAEKYGAYVNAIPDLEKYVAELKAHGVYPVARIVVFKDTILTRKRPDLAVKRPDGSVWTDRAGNVWLDPYSLEVWDYTFSVADACVAAGFEEIQFDYIRYPSDGDTKQCRYSYAQHNSSSAAANLGAFLEAANKRYKPLGIYLSIDIFGLIPSVGNDMGIGQNLEAMSRWVDFVSPMTYPSHYAKGEYGIPEPNKEPYAVVYRTLSDAKKRMGEDFTKLRPYLQDFSLFGVHYGPEQVKAQIQACYDAGVQDWLLWNPNSRFTKEALRPRTNAVQ
ncbi:MAG: hypothetical protein A3A86_03915 [Elusimicrobia bacterium RIFCSPLOWO2_01_FULL_60_11]|nr:MAG: hypothetical protein A3A86_03915 [Elusimicrobia bacterium RIFCSPLOWO2_01_FULL_60_11]